MMAICHINQGYDCILMAFCCWQGPFRPTSACVSCLMATFCVAVTLVFMLWFGCLPGTWYQQDSIGTYFPDRCNQVSPWCAPSHQVAQPCAAQTTSCTSYLFTFCIEETIWGKQFGRGMSLLKQNGGCGMGRLDIHLHFPAHCFIMWLVIVYGHQTQTCVNSGV